MKNYNVAILGATGAVGQEFLNLIEERKFPFANLKLLASKRSAGKKIQFMGKEYTVEEATEQSFDDVDIALVHQANGLIVNSLAEKLGMSSEVMPFKCANIGNTDMASIPTAMTELKKDGADYTKYHKALLSGFGAGLSVASMIMDLSDINILPTNEI